MSGLAKGAGSVPLNDVSSQAVESLLSSADWQQRLAEARVQREKVLAERAKQAELTPLLTPPKKPWEREPTPRRDPAARRPADPAAVAAAKAATLLPSVMRATRADAEPAEAAHLPGRLTGLSLPRPAQEQGTDTPRIIPLPLPLGAKDIPQGGVEPLPAPVTQPAPARSVAAAVPPLVAVERGQSRPLMLAVAAAFAAGLGLGGGFFLWYEGAGPAENAATPVAQAPSVRPEMPPALAGQAPGEASAGADIPGALGAPVPAKAAQTLAPPTASDRAEVVLAAPAIATAEPVATQSFGIGETSDVALPQGYADPRASSGHGGFVLSASGEDLPPQGVPPLPRPDRSLTEDVVLSAAPAPGEALSYPPSGSQVAPLRVSLPALTEPALDFGAGASSSDVSVASFDPGVLAAPPPPKAAVGAAFPHVLVRLLTSPRAAADATGIAERKLGGEGFVLSGSKAVTHKVNETHVRYYFLADQAAADAVAATLGVRARAFAPPGAATAPGVVEVWLGGPAPVIDSVAAVTKDVTGKPAPKVKAKAVGKTKKKANASTSSRRGQSQQEIQALRDYIIAQLRAGGQP